MKIILSFLLFFTFASSAWAFSTTNIQYLYGNFSGNSGFDTIGGKSTITLEHFSTYEYGDFYSFADFAIADDRFKNSDKSTDLYFELSPRISLSKVTKQDLSFLFIQDIFISGQYNRQVHKFKDFDAWLYGMGVNLNVKGFDVFGLNFYKKDKNLGKDSYQVTANYSSNDIFDTKFTISGFTDWTTQDILSQNKLLYKLDYSPLKSKVYVGTEWHYYKINNTNVESNVLQAMIMLLW
jgi:nucleoside-specific outer membrane channel protein Tsx